MWINLNSIIQRFGTALRISVGKETPINIYSKEQVDGLITTGSTDVTNLLGNKVDKVYIYGGSSNLIGIEKFIKDALNLPVIKIQNLSNVKFSKINESKVDPFKLDVELSQYLNAIGAIIRLR